MNRDDETRIPGPLYETYWRPDSGLERFHLRAMGTDNFFLLAPASGRDLRRDVQRAFEIIQRLEERLSKFLPQSDVSLANQLAAARPVHVGSDLLYLLERARQAWELSDGAFDPSVGPILSAWGLVDMRPRRPDPRDIERLLELRGMDRVRIDRSRGTVRFDRPGMSLDLGGMGKGYAVDAVARHLAGRVSAGSVISGRSSVVTWGKPPRGDSWRVEVVHPDDPDEALLTLEVEPGAISSSGAYERRIRAGTEEYGHVIDPRSGYPAETLRSATVWTRSALLGDILSTALFVLGEEAVAPGGCAERLVRAFTPEGEEPRASFLCVAPAPAAWGGVEVRTHHLGQQGFTEEG